jgi:hypothetical protein
VRGWPDGGPRPAHPGRRRPPRCRGRPRRPRPRSGQRLRARRVRRAAPDRLHVPDRQGRDKDTLVSRAADYERLIAEAGGVDVQILGIGANGHLGFNEPGSALSSRTRVKRLSDRTRHDNARFFDGIDDVPTHCVTQGLGTVLGARRLVLVASGAGKADAVAAALEGPLSASCPASVLQWHADATAVLDEAAAGGLRNRDYYDASAAGPVSTVAAPGASGRRVAHGCGQRTGVGNLFSTPRGRASAQVSEPVCRMLGEPRTAVPTACPHL